MKTLKFDVEILKFDFKTVKLSSKIVKLSLKIAKLNQNLPKLKKTKILGELTNLNGAKKKACICFSGQFRKNFLSFQKFVPV